MLHLMYVKFHMSTCKMLLILLYLTSKQSPVPARLIKRRKGAGVPNPDSLNSHSNSTPPTNSHAVSQSNITPVKRGSRKPLLRDCTPDSKEVVERAKLVFSTLLSTKNTFPDKEEAKRFHSKAIKFAKKYGPPGLRLSALARNPTLVRPFFLPLSVQLHA